MTEVVTGDELYGARREMHAHLVRGLFWLMTVGSAALTVRESVSGGPVLTAASALLLGVGALIASYRRGAPLRALGLALSCAMVLLIDRGALELGGATGSALSFGFIPGLMAILVLGPRWGWGVCGLMLASFALLFARTPLPSRYDQLRFVDEVAMTLFTAALAHALVRSFAAYEDAVARRRDALVSLRANRQALTATIYEELEPVSKSLADALEGHARGAADRTEVSELLRQLVDSLKRAKALSHQDGTEAVESGDPDVFIRRRAMRTWLRLAAALMVFFVLRNVVAGVPSFPSYFTLGFCLLFELWLRRPASGKHLELTALALGVLASGPMVAHIHAYGATPDAPALVVTPGTALFTALLSQGPATWAVVALQGGILCWVGIGKAHSLAQIRLLTDVGLGLVMVVIALRCVYVLRQRYAQALVQQGLSLAEALRQHRRLAGTLFHDVSNHVQTLTLVLELEHNDENASHARSLARRIRRLSALSKDFLLGTPASAAPDLEPLRVADAVASLNEAFGPRLDAKGQRLVVGPGLGLTVLAQPDLLVESVLGNLLSNAIKFSPRDSLITVRAEAVGPHVRVVVSDAGPGMPAEVLRNLDQEAAVPSRVGTAGEAGQGFGLQLAQEHLRRMGGRLELNPRAGGGTDSVAWVPSAQAV